MKNLHALAVLISALGLSTVLASTSSDPLDNWHWRSPSPTSNPLAAVVYGSNGFVAVADSRGGPVIVTSMDGTNWMPNNSGLGDSFYSVTYVSGLYLAAGYDTDTGLATFFLSTNGLDWTTITPQTNNYDYFYGVAYGNGRFVAVGDNGSVLTSADAFTWTEQSSATSNTFAGIAFGNGIFAAADLSGEIFTSADGASWQVRFSDPSKSFAAIAYANGKFVTVGSDGVILTSLDGISWSTQTSGTAAGLSGISSGNDHFVVVGYNVILTSTNGTNWTVQASDAALAGAAFGNGTFVAVGSTAEYGAAILTSADGTGWTERNSGPTVNLNGISYQNGLFVIVGDAGTVLTSADGWTWKGQASGTGTNLVSIAQDTNGLFVVVGDGATVLTSRDGSHWAAQDFGTNVTATTIRYGQGLFVALRRGLSSTILTSPDGTNWTVRLSDTGNYDYLNDVAAGNGRFVAVGGPGTYSVLATSVNGVNWAESIGPWSAALGNIVFGNGLFVVPVGGGVLTTPDGAAWDFHDLGFNPGRMIYDKLFSAVKPGTFSTSTNSTNWVPHATGFQIGLRGFAMGAGRVVVIGNAGAIYVSDPINPTLGIGPFPQFTLTGVRGFSYGIDASTNLLDWTSLTNLTLNANPVNFSDPTNGLTRRFYRARTLY